MTRKGGREYKVFFPSPPLPSLAQLFFMFCPFCVLVYFSLWSSCILVFFMFYPYLLLSLVCRATCLLRYFSPLPSRWFVFQFFQCPIFSLHTWICKSGISPFLFFLVGSSLEEGAAQPSKFWGIFIFFSFRKMFEYFVLI